MEPVIPDKLYKMSIGHPDTGEEMEFMIGPKYDHVENWHRFGQWVLKVATDDQGIATILVSEEVATRVVDQTGLGILVRDQITQSEYECYLDAQARQLDDSWLEE